MRQDVDALKRGLVGHIRIAAIPTALAMTAMLTTPYRAKHSQVRFTILSRTSIQILNLLENLEVDAGLTYLDNEPLGRVKSVLLYQEEYRLLTSAESARRPASSARPCFTGSQIMQALATVAPCRNSIGRPAPCTPLPSGNRRPDWWRCGRMSAGTMRSTSSRGALARAAISPRDGMVLLTSRVSVEMVQKAAAIDASVMVAVSALTSLAVRTAERPASAGRHRPRATRWSSWGSGSEKLKSAGKRDVGRAPSDGLALCCMSRFSFFLLHRIARL